MQEENSFLLNDLDKTMSCGIVTNDLGQIFIFHKQALDSEIQWIEYDLEAGGLSIIHEDGRVQSLGLSIKDTMKQQIAQSPEVVLIFRDDDKIISSQTVNIIIKDY